MKQTGPHRLGDAFPVVRHGDGDPPVRRCHSAIPALVWAVFGIGNGDGHLAVIVGDCFDRIEHKIDQHLLEVIGVRTH